MQKLAPHQTQRLLGWSRCLTKFAEMAHMSSPSMSFSTVPGWPGEMHPSALIERCAGAVCQRATAVCSTHCQSDALSALVPEALLCPPAVLE